MTASHVLFGHPALAVSYIILRVSISIWATSVNEELVGYVMYLSLSMAGQVSKSDGYGPRLWWDLS